MWSADISRREFFELSLGSTKVIEGRVRAGSQINSRTESELTVIWDVDPRERFSLPSLVIVANGDVQGLLSAITAAPQAPVPLTALSRILTREEAKQHFDSDILPLDERVFPALIALVFIEAASHGDARLVLKELTPLICKRTLSFAWGKAMFNRAAAEPFLHLPTRWLDVYSLLNGSAASSAAHRTVDNVVSGLVLLAELSVGIKPKTLGGILAFELLYGGKEGQELAWKHLAAGLAKAVGIDAFQALSREERGSYLQDALRALSSARSAGEASDVAQACAFLAARLAPGSLQHLEVLKAAGRPELLVWYAVFAALQSPKEILSSVNCLGFRLLRDLFRNEDRLAPPVADISYSELKIVARSGVEALSGRIGHASELLVELVPYVSTSFTFQLRNRARQEESQRPMELDVGPPPASPRVRWARAAAELAQLAKELPDLPRADSPPKKPRRKAGAASVPQGE